jgi:hypothetical protein
MSLIKSIADEVKKYLSVDISMNDKTIEPYIKPAEEAVIRLLGKDMYAALDEYYNGDNESDEELDALLPYVQRPIVNFAFFQGLSMLNVSIGDNGIAVVSNQNLTPASKQRTDDLKKDLERAAYDALESLLEFLEENIDDYDDWSGSDAYTYQYAYLISSARRFDELLRIDRSRLTFLNWRPTMADVEFLEISPVVSKEFCDELKEEIKADDVSEDNLLVLPYLQKALAYLTASLELDKKYENRGRAYLMEAKKIMDAAPDDYPTYAASSAYVATLTSYQKYENTEASNFFVTG